MSDPPQATAKPPRNRICATKPQVKVLEELYGQLKTPLSPEILELSKTTGLPEYWLNGWFSRRRRKSRINNGTIATFKAEYQDPAVPPASSTVLPSSVSTNASASAPVEPPLKKPRLPPTSSTAAPPGVNSNASASAPVGRPPKKPRNRKKVIPASSKTQALPAIKTEHQDAATIPPAAPPTISPGASSLDACLANAMHQGYVLDSFTHRWANSLKRGLPEDVHQVEPATAQGMLDFRTNAAVPPVPPVSDPSVFCSPDLRPNANSQATHTPEQHQTSTRPPPSNQALGSKKTTTATPIQSRKPGANTPAAHVPRAIQPNLKPLPWSYLYYDPVQKCTFTVPAAHIRPDTATSNLQSMLGSPFQPTPMIPRPHEILGMGYASARPAIKPFSSGVQHSSSSTPSSTHPHVYGQPRPGGICTDRAPLELLPSLIPGTVSTRLQQAPVPFLLPQIHSLDPAHLPAPLGPNDVTSPLKHLAVLADYTAQLTDGSYPPIDHATLTNLLLKSDSPQTDAFQTAMGLVFLSRLGLQWE